MPPTQPQKGDLICPPLSLGTFVRERHHGKTLLLQDFVQGQVSPLLKDFFCAMAAVGALEPLSATRPSATDVVSVFDRTVEIPPATLNADGVTVTPGAALLVQVCAGQNALVVEKLRALPANLTAVENGSVEMRRMAVMGFSEDWCPPGEPGAGQDNGVFQNVEHLVLCPEAGFDVWGINFDLFSKALISIHARMWSTC